MGVLRSRGYVGDGLGVEAADGRNQRERESEGERLKREIWTDVEINKEHK